MTTFLAGNSPRLIEMMRWSAIHTADDKSQMAVNADPKIRFVGARRRTVSRSVLRI
jgi:hypothetical protein